MKHYYREEKEDTLARWAEILNITTPNTPTQSMGVRGGGARGAPGSRCVYNVGLLWRVDCLLFVLSRPSSIFVK